MQNQGILLFGEKAIFFGYEFLPFDSPLQNGTQLTSSEILFCPPIGLNQPPLFGDKIPS